MAVRATDTGEVYYLTPDEEARLAQRARAGDGEAAFRLAQFWGMSGGRSGRAGDPENAVQQRRWLIAAAEAGRQPAKFNLALTLAQEDPSKGCLLLAEEVEAAKGTSNESNANSWLQSLCSGVDRR